MKHPKRNLFLLVILSLLLIGGYLFYSSSRFVPPTIPNPNGYDQLLAEAKQLAPRTGFYYEEGEEQRARIITTNDPVLERIQRALELPSVVPIDWDQPDLSAHLNDVQLIRTIARALSAARHEAKLAGDIAASNQYGLDLLKLSRRAQEGGLVTDMLTAAAYYGMGLGELAKKIDSLDQETCRDLTTAINPFWPLKEEGKLLDALETRVSAYIKRAHGTFQYLLASWQLQAQKQQMRSGYEEVLDRLESARQQLLLRLAIRQFQLDQERLPDSLDSLAPEYLPTIPTDPFTAGDFLYRASENSYELYSPGPDKVDNGNAKGSDDVSLDPSEDELEPMPDAQDQD